MLKKVIEFSIDRPILNHLLLLFIILVSIFAYINIPKEIFPPLEKDRVVISGGYVGTSADVLDKMVVQSIEDDLKNISDIDGVDAVIKNGSFIINADIKANSDNMSVLNDVKDVVSSVKMDLPSDMAEPISKLLTMTIPLVQIAVAGDDGVTLQELLSKAEELKRKLSSFKDLSDIAVRGESDIELVFRLNSAKIEAYGLSLNQVVLAIQKISSIFPIGTIKEKANHLYISTYNGEKDIENIRSTIIQVGTKHIKISDIVDADFQLVDEKQISHFNGMKNVSINIAKATTGNAIELVKQIRKVLEEEKLSDPKFTYSVYFDTSILIKNRLNTVFSNIVFGLILVFLAMLVFVNRGIALVVSMGIPLSFMIGLIVSEAMGYSLNMLSLLGVLIALGMLVDEAIVVAENIYRHLEEGKSRREAAVLGATEMFPAVLAATLTTVFAFLPLLLLSGDMGSFIKIIPIMISVLLVSSLFEAFFFLPLHSYDFLRLRKEGHVTHEIWEHLNRWYDKTLHLLFKKKVLSLIVMVLSILVATGYMLKVSKFQLFPSFDVTQLHVMGQVNINNDLQDTEQYVNEVENILLTNLSDRDMKSLTTIVGMQLDARNEVKSGENYFHIFVDLHESAPTDFYNTYINPIFSLEYDPNVLIRKRSAQDIADDIKLWLKPIESNSTIFEELRVRVPGAGVVAHDIEISLSGKTDAEMAKGIDKLENGLEQIEGIYGIDNDLELGEEELKLRVNSYGQELGFNENSINQELRSYYLKGEFSKMFSADGLVRLRFEGSNRDKIDSIKDFEVNIPNSNQYIALREVCDFIYQRAYVSLVKENGIRIRSVFASMKKDRITSDEVNSRLDPIYKELRADGFVVDVKGEAKENAKTKREMSQAFIMAIVLIFITLVWLFNSIVQSIMVLTTIPLVLLGVLIGHSIMGINLTMPGMIGVVGLAGVVVNDALIMVSFIRGTKNTEELMQKAKHRLRPILMTSITTVLGLSTLIFFAAGQAQILQPMAISLGFGITWATLLNLVYIPLLYAVIYRIKPPHPYE